MNAETGVLRRLRAAHKKMLCNLYWATWSDFFAMGGYGRYVWGSFGVTVFVMGAELLAIRARRAALKSTLSHGDSTE